MKKEDSVSATNQCYDYQDKFEERKEHMFFQVFSNFRNISCSPSYLYTKQNKADGPQRAGKNLNSEEITVASTSLVIKERQSESTICT